MKSQTDHNRITLLVVREAGRPVRQLQLSKPLALALPAVAVLSLSSLVTSMHFHASQSISQLEAEAAALTLTNLKMEMKVADKDQDLLQLRSQVTDLSEEAETIKDKLRSVSELEQQLQTLIDTSKGEVSGDSAASGTSASGSVDTDQMGGEYIAVHQQETLHLAQVTKDDFAEIRTLLDEMMNSITATITEAKEANEAKANLEAKKIQAEKQRLLPAVIWPTKSKVMTSSFGYRTDPFKGSSAFHSGIDIAGSIGDPVYAAMEGEVTAVDQQGARGKYIILKHPNGLETWYMHLSGMLVSPGDTVQKGEKIGLLGSTGRSTGPHLHFQVVKHNKTVNPLTYVKP
ncbi:M23 family metallopeptidase [Paenibacillus donghaensis]|uniref:M23ase beta-sheet core domain-containing protein n=1 Tax=Paenibacillus donghaensis TaxID=414771 RepID=A0A2Z2KJC4_9BACL|nr:M23 family metallopeptidase [Paenibacillus donghaensis]ASA26067.1 hypothetical protein B9T62_38375 [Paenibacillus donghaensis]